MADNISPLNLTVGEPVAPTELETTQDDTYGLGKGRIAYELQMQKLMDALDKRRQMPFDPMWMRVAAGFLKPTKTGSFGESLGYAAEGASEEAEKEMARKTDIEKLKMEIAAKQYGLAKQSAGMKMLGESMQPKGGAPMQSEAPADGMSTEQVVDIVKKKPSAIDQITLNPERVAAISAVDESFGKIAEQLYKSQVERAKLEMSRYEVNAQGDVYDKATNQVVKYGSRMVEVASPFDPDAKMPIRAGDLDEYSALDFSKPAEVNAWLRKKGLGAYAIGKEAKATVGPDGEIVPATEGQTTAERKTSQAIKEKRAESDIKRDEEDKTKIFASQTNAIETLAPNASSILRYASNPATSKAFGYLSKKGVGNAIASLVENGVTIGNWRIGLTDVGDALRKVDPNISQQDIEALQAVAQNMARLELGFSQAFKGQGQVSDFERKIVQSIGPQKNDTARVAALKSELILARAKMDELTAEAYSDWSAKNPNGYVTDFRNKNAEYKRLVRQYNAKLEQIQKKYGFEQRTSWLKRLQPLKQTLVLNTS